SGKAINQAIATNYAPGLRKEPQEIVKSSAKKSSSSSTSTATAPKAVDEKRELTDEEKAQRKQLGMIFMCWSIVIPAMLDTFVLWDLIWRRFLPIPGWFPYVLTIFVGIPLAFSFYNSHVKPK